MLELVAVLVLSCCIVCAHCDLTGTILNQTILQDSPGAGASTVMTTLFPSDVVTVHCRTSDALVYDDPWWLYVTYVSQDGTSNATSMIGWVADYDVDCGNVGNCAVLQCT